MSALVVDIVVVWLPFTFFMAVLFELSGGHVQSAYGLLYPYCTQRQDLPVGLDPQPLRDFTVIEDCRLAFPGMDTARILRIGIRQPKQGFGGDAFQTYWLDADGLPSQSVLNLGFIAFLTYPIYAIALESRRGKTIGKRMMRIKVIDLADRNRNGIPFGKAFRRQAVMFVLGTPIYAARLFADNVLIPASESFVQVVTSPVYAWIDAVGYIFSLLCTGAVVVSLVRKRDPIYDRLAGTAVIGE